MIHQIIKNIILNNQKARAPQPLIQCPISLSLNLSLFCFMAFQSVSCIQEIPFLEWYSYGPSHRRRDRQSQMHISQTDHC